jgi:hypothetical protein
VREKHGDFESARKKKRLRRERENTPEKSGAKKKPEWERERECERKWIIFLVPLTSINHCGYLMWFIIFYSFSKFI